MDKLLRRLARIIRIPPIFVVQVLFLLILVFFALVVPGVVVVESLSYFERWGSPLGDRIELVSSIVAWIFIIGSIVWLVIYDIRNYKKVFGFETQNKKESSR